MSKASLCPHDLYVIASAAKGSSEQTFVHQEEKIIENVHSQYWTVENRAVNLVDDIRTGDLGQRALNAAMRAETVISKLEAHHNYRPDATDGGSDVESVVLTDAFAPIETISDSTIVGSVDLTEGGMPVTVYYT